MLETVEELLKVVEEYADKQDYCWFRLTKGKVGDAKSQFAWYACIEGLEVGDVFGGNTIKEALTKLLGAIRA